MALLVDYLRSAVIWMPRPEYASQSEAIMTDLLWRSPGSPLTELYRDLGPTRRLVYDRDETTSDSFTYTRDLAMAAIAERAEASRDAIEALLASLEAPRARKAKSRTLIPIALDSAVFQNLNGIVAKDHPANLALACELLGLCGGSTSLQDVCSSFLRALETDKSLFADWASSTVSSLAPPVWAAIAPPDREARWSVWPGRRGVGPAPPSSSSSVPRSPASWFWRSWQTLMSPEWVKALPLRRWIDWALCVLRTGLSLHFLWEAVFLNTVIEACARDDSERPYLAVQEAWQEGLSLLEWLPAHISASEKEVWPAIRAVLDKNAPNLEAMKSALGSWNIADFRPFTKTVDPMELEFDLKFLREHGVGKSSIAPGDAVNAREFVRYTLLPRASAGSGTDQSDFYYLLRSDTKRSTWVEPGPEWLVVVASLACSKPGGECTLGQLSAVLSEMGIRAQRSVLISALERAGLTSDSPDADAAVVIKAAF